MFSFSYYIVCTADGFLFIIYIQDHKLDQAVMRTVLIAWTIIELRTTALVSRLSLYRSSIAPKKFFEHRKSRDCDSRGPVSDVDSRDQMPAIETREQLGARGY